ncbi:hypothetical protein NH286_00905 [Anaerococcus sp. NML200574]|uniref:hypothetical protein n=1 Tax=Anaerococcus sp. NML200574 TaxID=2954486 RepID=UPI0022385376|nr:hypothetical protein [Anaerococcus sp. NML200574]MCW6677711.1 hypothetical protein [Anaerococcus sp. NML200574]
MLEVNNKPRATIHKYSKLDKNPKTTFHKYPKWKKGATNPTTPIIIRPQKAYDYIKQIAASTGRRRHLP